MERRRADVLVIGTGGAGLRAAIAATEAGATVLVVGKRGRRDAHTVLAAGGINAALGTVDPQDSWEQHFADTYLEGYALGDPGVAEIMTREAPAAVRELAEWGCPFARLPDGRLDQRFFGAHRWRRTCYVADSTGKAIIQTLADRAESLAIPIDERRQVSRLLVHDGRCAGALSLDLRSGERTAYEAGAVIVCGGGHTTLWRPNTSRTGENYGEGIALALDAGCRLMDMELVQFHPTGMVAPEDLAGTLVTEAVRGEGGRLFNALGERFMERYDPARMELSTRDRVAFANYTEIIEGRAGPNGGVFLDISHRGLEYILEKLPRMHKQFLSFQGLDISKDPMEVAPTAHYTMGGVVVEPETHATDLPGLFAAGECAAGLHGANRLGGNSLVDIVVFGRRAGEAAAALAAQDGIPDASAEARAASDELDGMVNGGADPTELLRELQDVMWRRCGVVRSLQGLEQGLMEVAGLATSGPNAGEPAALGRALDLRAAVLTAEATLRGAIERRETRGAHHRSEFPDTDPTLRVNFLIARDPSTGRLEVTSRPVPDVSDELQGWLDQTPEMGLGDRLLE
ncbi:MAG TPA: FAD-dependent oxidoreductase [Actinomycetota bacterium]|nr:FAD-dependent oxidoreductase [Actinomycetota bacterium]